MLSTLPERKDVPVEYTWDLSKLFESDDAWKEALRSFEEKLPQIEKFKGTLGTSPDALFRCLEFMKELDMAEERLGYYAHLKTTEDAGNSEHQDRFSRYLAVSARKAALASYQIPEIQAIPDEVMQSFLSDPLIEPYRISLSKILKFKPHVLSTSEERLIAMQIESRETPQKAFNALTNVDFDFGTIETPEGFLPLTQSSFSVFIQHQDRNIRRKAYLQFYNTYNRHRNALSALYEGNVQQDIYLARVRNYSSARAMSLFPDQIPESVYDNLITVVRDNLQSLHRYYGLRKKLLGLDTLRHYDVYVPLVQDIQVIYPYEKAVETVIEALEPLGREYCETLKGGLLGRWVDRYENKGKTSGAFSAGSYFGDPYILMNYKEDVLKDVFTIAHESGHSMHSYYSVRNNPFQHYSYTIFEAEVASTFNEQLLFSYLLKKADSKKMRAYLVGKEVDDIIATLFRQTMFAEFEHKTHWMVENGIPLTVDSLRATYRELLKAYFGPEMEFEDVSDLEGLRIPHFYRAFYVYKYATGLSAAIALAQRVLGGGDAEREAYMNFLKSGGSRYPLESLRIAGVDMEKPEPIQAAMDYFTRLTSELTELLGA